MLRSLCINVSAQNVSKGIVKNSVLLVLGVSARSKNETLHIGTSLLDKFNKNKDMNKRIISILAAIFAVWPMANGLAQENITNTEPPKLSPFFTEMPTSVSTVSTQSFAVQAGAENNNTNSFSAGALPPQLAQTSYNNYWEQIELAFLSSGKLDRKSVKVNIQPNADAHLTINGNTISISGDFVPATKYRITVHKGLSDNQGGILEEDIVTEITIPDMNPSVSIISSGEYLPITSERLVMPYQTVNCKSVRVQLLQAYENNLNPYYEIEWVSKSQMVLVAEKEFKFADPKNKKTIHKLDIESLLGGRKPGAYKLLLFANDERDSWEAKEQSFLLTDMALQATTDVSNSQAIVFIRSISTGKPIAKADVTLLSKKNQVVAKGKSDDNGSLLLKYDLAWNREDDSVVAVFAKKGDDITYFRLNQPQALRQEKQAYQPNKPKAFVFAERGVCRPGESFTASVFLRQTEENSYKPMGKVPVTLVVQDPNGRKFTTANLTTDEYGFVQTDFAIPATAQTGFYRVDCMTAGLKKSVGTTTIQIAAYVPDRIKVSGKCLTESPNILEPINFEFDAQYYFGMPVKKGYYKCSITAKPANTPSHWDKSWSYGDTEMSEKKYAWTDSSANANLPVQITYPGFKEQIGDAFQPMDLNAEMSISEPGGRGVTDRETVLLHPTDWYIGLRDTDNSRTTKTVEFTLLPARPNENLTLKNDTDISFSLIKKEWDYIFTKVSDNKYKRQWILRETALVDRTIVQTLPAGTTIGDWIKQVSWELPSGQYKAIAQCGDTYRSVLEFTHYSGEGGGRTSNPMNIYFKTDAEIYNPGETVTFTFDAFDNGEAFLVAGEKGMGGMKTAKVKRGKNEMKISIPKNINTASYFIGCTVVSKNEESTGRSFGLLKVNVDQTKKHRLDVGIALPATANPEEEIPVTLTLKNSEGNPEEGLVCLYAVDSGVTSLTKYKAPDIFNYFYGEISCPMSFYDMYGMIYEDLKITPDGQIGGDGDEEIDRKLATVKQKESARLICPPITISKSGTVSTTVKLPEHVGAMDVFAVASSTDFVGSTNVIITMRNNVAITITTPRYIAPGDTAELTFSLFNVNATDSQYECTVALPDSLEKINANTSLTFTGTDLGKGAQTNIVLSVRAKEIFGSEKISAQLKIGNDISKANKDITIRSVHVSETISYLDILSTDQTKQITIADAFVGTPNATLRLSASPALGVQSALNWLNEYPYGCLEQTVARAFPYIGVPALVNSGLLDQAVANTVRSKVGMGYAQILQMALSDGSFSMWPGEINNTWKDATLFAHHFIFEAVANNLLSIDNKSRQRYLQYLRNVSSDASLENRNSRAYAIYILAVAGDKSFTIAARNMVANSDRADYALFLAGAALIKGGYANIGIRPMEAALKAQCWKYTGVPTEYADDTCRLGMALYILMDCNVQNSTLATQFALDLAKLLHPDDSVWGTTQANAWATLGLAKYAEKYPTSPAQVKITSTDGEQTLDVKDCITLDASKVESILNTSNGVLIAQTIVTGIPRNQSFATNGNLILSKEFLNEKGEPINTAVQGEKVYVRIRFESPVPLKNIAIADLLPAGLEIEDESLATRSSANELAQLIGESMNENAMNPRRQEKRDDRFLIFGDSYEGESVFYYQTRAISRGTFAVPPSHAEAMYNPEMKGSFNQIQTFTVK